MCVRWSLVPHHLPPHLQRHANGGAGTRDCAAALSGECMSPAEGWSIRIFWGRRLRHDVLL